MAEDHEMPFGIDPSQLKPSSLQSADHKSLRTKQSTKKTPFQKHKEERERKRKQEEEATAALLGDFVASFAEKQTSQTFVKTATIVQTENRQMVVEGQREEYKMDGLSKLNSKAEDRRRDDRERDRRDRERERERERKPEKKREIDELREVFRRAQQDRDNPSDGRSQSSSYPSRQQSRSDSRNDSRSDSYSRNDSRSDSRNDSYSKDRSRDSTRDRDRERDSRDSHSSQRPVDVPSPVSPNKSKTPLISQIAVIPPEDKVRNVIDNLAQFVVSEGPLFEQLVIRKEAENPLFTFLFNLGSPPNLYYRWRVFSLLNGDTLASWRTVPFQMFTNGPFWIPPPCVVASTPSMSASSSQLKPAAPTPIKFETSPTTTPPVLTPVLTTDGAPIDLSTKFHGKPLSDPDRDYFEDLVRYLSIERSSIREAMGFALEHAESAPEIVEVLSESLTILKTSVLSKIARLYLVSDILYNVQSVPNGSLFRSAFEETLLSVFTSFRQKYQTITGRITQQNFKDPVLKVLHTWSEWCIYSQSTLKTFYDAFLDTSQPPPSPPLEVFETAPIVPSGPVKFAEKPAKATQSSLPKPTPVQEQPLAPVPIPDDDIDGDPLGDDDLDGLPLDDDLDGEPL